MNISSNNYGIKGSERLYQQFNPRVKLNIPEKVQQKITENAAMQPRINNQSLTAQDILSSREIDTLQALFNSQTKSSLMYGHKQTRSIQAGFLLDLKG
ncbi:MAG: hypothetical protein KAR20_28695 [Candidatus Heimdallarchaeota archaeon]|nr:hypothetical protein [Candidatus Heimdallarchaeota archaeon]